MIENDLQYQITKSEADKFAEAVTYSDEENANLHPRLRQAMRESLESQLQDLRRELAEYEALRDNHIAVLELDSLTQLPEALVRARKAAGLTQKELGRRLGLKEQQIQRYEATRYAGANLTRVQAVVDALGVRIHERVILPTAASAAETARAYAAPREPNATPRATSSQS
ncbi:MAG: helix-turn-helix domain-containing protein [Chloroflexota bacterium]|jgi:ribosome-binding protein aMBF1 (putative translation factor)|nr:helix-turn-helix domain-containing protein [Chloroflexota bacterium]